MDDKEQTRIAYNRLSRWYDVLAGGFEDRHRGAGVRKLAPCEGETILEIGCGTGRSLVTLKDRVGSAGLVYGLDISEGMLAVSRARVHRAGAAGRVLLVQGDAMQLPLAENHVDGILLSFTLELFDAPGIPLVLGECWRVLRSGGRICVVAMAETDRPNGMTRLYTWLHERFPRYVDCQPISPRGLLEANRFGILEVTNSALFGLPIALVLAEKPIVLN